MKPKTISLLKALMVFFSLVLVFETRAQDTSDEKKVKILPVPSIGYAPETKTYLGAVSLFTIDLYKDSLTRVSNAKVELTFTWNKQLIAESEWNYFFKKEKWFTQGKLHYSKYPDLYYGVGGETPQSNELAYESQRFFFNASLLRNLGNKWFLGPQFKFADVWDIETEVGEIYYPELENASVFGLGISLLKDSRNNLLTPTKGLYVSISANQNFSDMDYRELTVDLRAYQTWKRKYTWANRLYTDVTTDTPPFFDYAMLGGDKFVRGYYLGRYRDNNLSLWQSEFRMPVYRRFSLAVFGGLSNLYSKENPFDINQTKWNGGMGLRYLVDRSGNTFLRVDYAIGENENSGFYISFGESF